MFYTTEQLGPTQSMTPDGFLLCSQVPIARTGTQLYITDDFPDGDSPVTPDQTGQIRIAREAAEVFRAETIASFEGKPVTIDHTFITPENAKQFSVGHAQNVRRGTGVDDDLLYADLLITDAEAIAAVRKTPGVAPTREVSCGYDADYEELAVGHGRQINIIGNHVALVKRGRAGPRCSIQDKEPVTMKTQDKATLWARIRKAFLTQDAKELESAIAEDSDETAEEKAAREAKDKDKKTEDAIEILTKTVDSLAKVVGKLTKDAEGESETEEEKAEREAKEKKTKDELTEEESESAAMMGDTAGCAEIMIPGFSMPTKDSVKTRDGVVAVQRSVLAAVGKTEEGRALLAPLMRKHTVDSLPKEAVPAIFAAATELARVKNNGAGFKLAQGAKTTDSQHPANRIAAINQANKDFWSNRK